MNEDDVFELDKRWREGDFGAADEAIEALRTEAWYPIDKAEEMGAKDGRDVLIWSDHTTWFEVWWSNEHNEWLDVHQCDVDCEPTHFRFINPPEGN